MLYFFLAYSPEHAVEMGGGSSESSVEELWRKGTMVLKVDLKEIELEGVYRINLLAGIIFFNFSTRCI